MQERKTILRKRIIYYFKEGVQHTFFISLLELIIHVNLSNQMI
jgi:hypothetical protein